MFTHDPFDSISFWINYSIGGPRSNWFRRIHQLAFPERFPVLDQHATRSSWQWKQYNESIHCSNLAKEFFEYEHISVIDCPIRSLDLNLVENIFLYLVKVIHAKNKQFNNKNELCDIILKAVLDISRVYIKDLYNSMSKLFWKVLKLQGKETHY